MNKLNNIKGNLKRRYRDIPIKRKPICKTCLKEIESNYPLNEINFGKRVYYCSTECFKHGQEHNKKLVAIGIKPYY